MQQLDGAPVTPSELQALALVNFGHFTTMRVTRAAVRGRDLHLARLARDARTLFDIALDPALVRTRVRGALADEPDDVVARVTLFDPALPLERTGAPASPRILVTPRPAPRGPASALRLRSTAYRRDAPRIKHTGLFGALAERRAAQRAGFDDAVFADAEGRLSEGPTWSIGFWDGDGIVWPEADVLEGVTRSLLGGGAREIRLRDLSRMHAAFAANAGTGIRPVASIDDVTWDAGHPALARIAAAYEAIAPQPL